MLPFKNFRGSAPNPAGELHTPSPRPPPAKHLCSRLATPLKGQNMNISLHFSFLNKLFLSYRFSTAFFLLWRRFVLAALSLYLSLSLSLSLSIYLSLSLHLSLCLSLSLSFALTFFLASFPSFSPFPIPIDNQSVRTVALKLVLTEAKSF